MGRRAHKPDPNLRRQVEALAAYGIPAAEIGRTLGVDAKTLRKHYRDELDLGATKANSQVASFLFTAAKSGNLTAQIFWLKTRARWKEPANEYKHSGSLGTYDMTKVSDADLARLESILAPVADAGANPDGTGSP
jgi:hypothetical protein